MSEAVIEARGVRVRFGRRRVLDGLDLDVARGSVTALVGRNGAGKSTLLRVLVGALVPDGGATRVLGLDPSRQGARVRARVGYVADRLDVPAWVRGRDWLAFVAQFHPKWNAECELRYVELLELDVATKVAEMSKGTRAKLALVAALAHEPDVLLLDEPFSGLDSVVRRSISTAVLTSLRDDARTVLLVSHSLSDVERLADRVAILTEGRVERVVDADGLDLETELMALPASNGA